MFRSDLEIKMLILFQIDRVHKPELKMLSQAKITVHYFTSFLRNLGLGNIRNRSGFTNDHR